MSVDVLTWIPRRTTDVGSVLTPPGVEVSAWHLSPLRLLQNFFINLSPLVFWVLLCPTPCEEKCLTSVLELHSTLCVSRDLSSGTRSWKVARVIVLSCKTSFPFLVLYNGNGLLSRTIPWKWGAPELPRPFRNYSWRSCRWVVK